MQDYSGHTLIITIVLVQSSGQHPMPPGSWGLHSGTPNKAHRNRTKGFDTHHLFSWDAWDMPKRLTSISYQNRFQNSEKTTYKGQIHRKSGEVNLLDF